MLLAHRLLCPVLLGLVSLTPAVAHEASEPGHSHDAPASEASRAFISPTLARVEPGATQTFKASLWATYLLAAQVPDEVTWSVEGLAGEGEVLGTIDAGGTYTAPAEIPSPPEVHVIAKVPGAANPVLFATVLVGGKAPSYELASTWSEPLEESEFDSPHGIGLDKDGGLLIADEHAGRVLRYTADGEFRGALAEKGDEPGQVKDPREVNAGPDGHIWVTDSKGDRPRIQVFSHEGEFERIFGEKGIQPGQILRTHGFDFDSEKRLYTVDIDNFRVNVYSYEGEFLYDFGKIGNFPGEFNAPHGLEVDPAGDVFVSSYYGPVQKFDKNGKYLLSFLHGDPPDGLVYFHNITDDRWGNMYVMVRGSDGAENRVAESGETHLSILKFNNHGDYITGWGLNDPKHRESAAVVAEDGSVYSLFHDDEKAGVQTFKPR